MKKLKFIFLLVGVCKQVIWKSGGYGNYILLPFDIETS